MEILGISKREKWNSGGSKHTTEVGGGGQTLFSVGGLLVRFCPPPLFCLPPLFRSLVLLPNFRLKNASSRVSLGTIEMGSQGCLIPSLRAPPPFQDSLLNHLWTPLIGPHPPPSFWDPSDHTSP